MLDEGRIKQTTAILLMQSVDEAIDSVSHEPLRDWKGLKAHVHFPSYYRFLQMSVVPQKLVTYFTVERLESACYICAAFLQAHRIARRQLHEFIGVSEIASIIINESYSEGEEARKFLEDVRVTFPQVLRVVKTRQATYSILKHLSEYVHSLEKAGILEQKEMFHLHDCVQTDLKKLLRNPPLVKMPKIRDILSAHPMLAALPSVVCEPLVNSTKQTMKLRGVTLYREATKPTGIWLISNGVVKWSSKIFENRHSLHPTFSHGSTLGLYEVLVGKPYICDIVTDSVVQCFFIESERILQVLGSDSVEELLWQECAIFIAKLLLPQNFENMAMQDLRVLVAERSTMKIYIRGEIIEIRPHTIGFVLEGFVKTQDAQDNLITSPAALLPSYADVNLHNLKVSGVRMGNSSHQGAYYNVETRARVIIFDMAPFDASGRLQRKSSSLVDLTKSQTREHGSLMSWPEHLYKHHQHTGRNNGRAKSMSERAMGLSIFGSMINQHHRHNQSFPRSSSAKPSHNHSYPRIESSARPLTSVKSEGATTIGEKLRCRESAGSKPCLLPVSRKKTSNGDNSSDESGPDDEHIVRIDSPSRLSFRQSSRLLVHPHPGGS